MQESERQIIKQFTVALKRDIIPTEMLSHLWCLTEDDCESIQYKQEREGPRAAVPTLLDRLKKREGAFKQFLTALEETGCLHLKTSLQNAMRDQTHQPEPDHNSNKTTPDTTSNVESENLKTPTAETTSPFPGSSLTKTKQPLTSHTSKKPNKTPKTKKNRIPKENTTSPPETKTNSKTETKTNSKTKTKPVKSHQEHSIPTGAKQTKATKGMPTTPSQISSASQQITKCPSTTPKKPICTSAKSDPTPTFQPSETKFKNPTTHFDTLICYARENCEIALELKQFLESKCGLKVCIDMYNFVPGKPTTDNICDSIYSSQSFVFLLSPTFPTKLWAQWELKNAVYDFNVSQQSGNSKNIIPVLLEGCQLPDDLKLYTPIEMEGSGSRKGAWKKIAETILGRPFQGDANNVDDGVEDSTDDVDVSNDDGVHDEVDDGINDNDDDGDDDDNVLDGYDDGEDNHGDTNDGGAENVGVYADGSNNSVDDSNSSGNYHGENGVHGSDNCGVEEDDDDDVDTSSDGKEDHDDDSSDDGGNDDAIKDSTDDGRDDSVDDGNDCGDHDEDGHQDNEGANDGPDDVGHDRVNHNDSGIDNNVIGGGDGSGGNNDDDDANKESKTDVASNDIRSL